MTITSSYFGADRIVFALDGNAYYKFLGVYKIIGHTRGNFVYKAVYKMISDKYPI